VGRAFFWTAPFPALAWMDGPVAMLGVFPLDWRRRLCGGCGTREYILVSSDE